MHGIGGLNLLVGKIELVDDNLTLNEEFKKNVAIPYFKDIYKDIQQWSDNKAKGINKISILTVPILYLSVPILLTLFMIVFTVARHHRGEVLFSIGPEWRWVCGREGVYPWVLQGLLLQSRDQTKAGLRHVRLR